VAKLVKLEPKAKVLAAGFNDGGAHLLDNTALSILAFNVILPVLLVRPKGALSPENLQFYGKPRRSK
jgi:hypothetical protein